MNKEIDILIIGGGLTGGALMLALKGLGYSLLLVDDKPFADKTDPDFDARTLALAPASFHILSMLNVWPHLEQVATAIEHIHVSDQYRFGATRLKASMENPLGYIVEMRCLHRALYHQLSKENMIGSAKLTDLDCEQHRATLSTPEGDLQVSAKLIIAADGANSAVRRLCHLSSVTKDYHQTAIVANIKLARPHQNRAFERFTMQGPLALLPMSQQRMALVWAMSPKEARRMILLEDADFLKSLQRTFGYRLGRFVKTGQRVSYPIKQTLMHKQTLWPVVFLGNTAHTLHPVAGQGFNLSLRDIAMLAQLIAKRGIKKSMLEEYQQLRQADQNAVIRMTDGLMTLFTSQFPGIKIARNIGMIAMDNCLSAKHRFACVARGFTGVIPDLACEIPLHSPHTYNEER